MRRHFLLAGDGTGPRNQLALGRSRWCKRDRWLLFPAPRPLRGERGLRPLANQLRFVLGQCRDDVQEQRVLRLRQVERDESHPAFTDGAYGRDASRQAVELRRYDRHAKAACFFDCLHQHRPVPLVGARLNLDQFRRHGLAGTRSVGRDGTTLRVKAKAGDALPRG